MRGELQRLQQTGEDLRTWRRRFILDPALRPCRQSVISDPVTRIRADGGWTQQRGALMTEAARKANAGTLQRLASTLNFVPDTTYVSNEAAQRHEIASGVPMQNVIDMLTDYQLEEPRDSANFTGLLVTLVEALRRDGNLTAGSFGNKMSTVNLYRTINDDGTIDNFLQGRTDRAGGYPGDTFYSQRNQLSVQWHAYELRAKWSGGGAVGAIARFPCASSASAKLARSGADWTMT